MQAHFAAHKEFLGASSVNASCVARFLSVSRPNLIVARSNVLEVYDLSLDEVRHPLSLLRSLILRSGV